MRLEQATNASEPNETWDSAVETAFDGLARDYRERTQNALETIFSEFVRFPTAGRLIELRERALDYQNSRKD